jgi:hypothetical protein
MSDPIQSAINLIKARLDSSTNPKDSLDRAVVTVLNHLEAVTKERDDLVRSIRENEAVIRKVLGKSIMSYPAINAAADVAKERDALKSALKECGLEAEKIIEEHNEPDGAPDCKFRLCECNGCQLASKILLSPVVQSLLNPQHHDS